MSNPSISASVNYNYKLNHKDWHYMKHNMDLLTQTENKFNHKKTCLRKKVSETSTKRSKLRDKNNKEMKSQCKRENHETIQQLSSKLQQMQEQTNSVNDSGDFQEVEMNRSEKLSHVSSQRAMIPSSRSLHSRDTRLPFDTWSQPGYVFENQYSMLDSARDHPQRNSILRTTERTRKYFSKFRDAGCKDRFCSDQDHPEFQSKKVSREFQSKKVSMKRAERRPVSTEKTDHLHDLRLLSSNGQSYAVLDYADFFCYSS